MGSRPDGVCGLKEVEDVKAQEKCYPNVVIPAACDTRTLDRKHFPIY